MKSKERKKKKIIICIIARIESKRLPEKVIKMINNKTIIEHLITKLKIITCKDIELAICTTSQKRDDKLEDIARKHKIHCIRGSVLSVSDRILEAAKLINADIIVRVTGDNIFTDPNLLQKLMTEHITENAEYSRIENIPIGVTAEIINVDVLKKCYQENNKEESEYMTLHLYQPKKYKTLVLVARDSNETINLSVDTPNDFVRTVEIFKHLKNEYTISDVINIIKKHRIPNSIVDKEAKVKLIDKVLEYKDYKKYLLKLRQQAITKTISI
jgi:spore coat polysaccharide biosynthesis protein SpsF